QCAVPFTPVTGPRLLVDKGEDSRAVKAGLAAGLKAVTDKLGVSSAHVTFAQLRDVEALEAAGFLHRTDQQFHFFNEGYSTYDD
ncbi:MAG: GNAT family N-acetyltransferase, partial [Mesorhizobium sp.]